MFTNGTFLILKECQSISLVDSWGAGGRGEGSVTCTSYWFNFFNFFHFRADFGKNGHDFVRWTNSDAWLSSLVTVLLHFVHGIWTEKIHIIFQLF